MPVRVFTISGMLIYDLFLLVDRVVIIHGSHE